MASPSAPELSSQLNHIFHALADPTRREVFERLSGGPLPMTELAREFDMKLPSFSQHLEVLENCGLVKSAKAGRVRTYRIAPEPLRVIDGWLVRQRAKWEARLDRLDAHLEEE
jgi:DNA-binding transcriptional ArsR family regulator